MSGAESSQVRYEQPAMSWIYFQFYASLCFHTSAEEAPTQGPAIQNA